MKQILVLLFMILFTGSVYSQELSIAPVKMWTDNAELCNPFGYSIGLYQSLGKVGIKVGYGKAYNSREYYGVLISGFFKHNQIPAKENVTSDSEISFYDLSLVVYDIVDFEYVSVNIGGGFSINMFDGKRQGLISGNTVNLYEEKKYGYFYFTSVSSKSLFNLPFKIELLFKHQRMIGLVQVTDIEQPFEGALESGSLQLNFVYLF